jgi:DNA polymerase III subunit epsilon
MTITVRSRATPVRPRPEAKHQAATRPRQQSFDDLGVPLSMVTFCVIDIETTGASANFCAITEVAAARYEGGRCTGTFQTLINPGTVIPPEIVYLTGITQAMVLPAPRIEQVLQALLDFVRDAVIVGHNVRFDLSFLNMALIKNHYPAFTNRVVDTCRLARRLVRAEVANCRLGTLSAHFGFANQPTHRALDDVRATADLLHLLLERASGFGVLGLDDLIELPAINRHPQAHKLHLTNHLPRSPGVYLFRDAAGTVLYVGKATNLRARVRSYFSSDDRRKIGALLQVVHRIDHVPCQLPIEAAVLEIRLIQREMPRFNRQAKLWTNYAYIRIVGDGPTAKITSCRDTGGVAGAVYVGPFASITMARASALALREAAQFSGLTEWAGLLLTNPSHLLRPLAERMRALAGGERFEEAAALRDRAGTLARAIDRQRKVLALRRTDWLELCLRNDELTPHVLRLDRGRLRFTDGRFPASDADPAHIERQFVDELWALAQWIEKATSKLSVAASTAGLAWPAERLPRFEPVTPRPGTDDIAADRPDGATATDQPVTRNSFEVRTRPSRAAIAAPLSTDRAARSKPSVRSRAIPPTTSPAAALSTTMSRWAPRSPSSTRRR